jgi:hypothetical protein
MSVRNNIISNSQSKTQKLVGKLRSGVEAISLIKGMEVKMEGP